MGRGPLQRGDTVVIGAVDGTTGLKKYELVPARNNYTYSEQSDQPEAQPNQALAWPLSFHAGLGEGRYHPTRSPGYASADGVLGHRPNVIAAALKRTTVTLTGTANAPQYYFETNVGSTSSGKPVLYIITNEAAEVNVYKVSLDSADFGTLLVTKTFSVTPTQPCGQPAEWNNGTDTRWYLGLGDSTNRIQRLATIATGSSADTWTASSDADARHLKVVGNRLMRSTNENQVSLLPRAGNPLTEASWGSDFFVGDVSSNITELGEAGGLSYVATESGFFEWDTVGQPVNILPEIGKAPRNGQGMVYWHGGFMIPTATGLWWTRTGSPVGPDTNPHNIANHPGTGVRNYGRHASWTGLAAFGQYIFANYVSDLSTIADLILFGRERRADDPSSSEPLVWNVLDTNLQAATEFNGIFTAQTSERSETSVIIRPSLWFGFGNNVGFQYLDHDGAPLSFRTRINQDDLNTLIVTGEFDFDLPRVNKQFRVIDGWAEDMSTNAAFRIRVYVDGGSAVTLGSDVTADGYFENFWTQDTSDTGRSLQVEIDFRPNSQNDTNTNGSRLRDVMVRAVALPDMAQIWTFNFYVRDEQVKTAKKIRSELEGFVNDLKQYELPDGDKVNGVMTSVRLLRADEINELFSDMQPPPKYVLQAQVREMVSS